MAQYSLWSLYVKYWSNLGEPKTYEDCGTRIYILPPPKEGDDKSH